MLRQGDGGREEGGGAAVVVVRVENIPLQIGPVQKPTQLADGLHCDPKRVGWAGSARVSKAGAAAADAAAADAPADDAPTDDVV